MMAMSSQGTMRSGRVAVIADDNDWSGANPWYAYVRRTALVTLIGLRHGQTASTMNPTFARAMPRRAVGNQRDVVAIRAIGFIST